MVYIHTHTHDRLDKLRSALAEAQLKTELYPFFVAHPDVLVEHGHVAQYLGAEGTDGAAAVFDGVLPHEVNRAERLVTIRALHAHPAAA